MMSLVWALEVSQIKSFDTVACRAAGLAALAALTNLCSLNLAQCTGLRDDCRFALRQLPHLTSLDLSQCHQLGEAVNELQWMQVLSDPLSLKNRGCSLCSPVTDVKQRNSIGTS